jgi:predicted O-methyltransferase YrrM
MMAETAHIAQSARSVISRLEQDPDHLHANWTLPPQAARFVYLLSRIGRFKQILEVGTSIGYSTLHFAWAASENQGHVTTIDASEERQSQARRNLAQAGLEDVVTPLLGDAIETLTRLAGEKQKYDLMFLDARKDQYIDYLRLGETLLEPGGVLLADNTQSHRKDMQDFIDAINASPDWMTADIDTPNGFILARKLSGESP